MASGKLMFSAFIRNCTGPPFASQTKQRYELRPGLSYDSVDGLTMKLPSVLSSWNGHSPVRFTPALRRFTKSPTTSSIFACSMTVLMMSSLIFGIGCWISQNPGENPTKPEYPPQSPIYIYINI